MEIKKKKSNQNLIKSTYNRRYHAPNLNENDKN
jgi:hypothetical protein